MDREYADPKGNACISIDDFFPSPNMLDPGSYVSSIPLQSPSLLTVFDRCFRLWSWRDRMTFAADYNSAVISKEEITALVEDWLNIMRRCYV